MEYKFYRELKHNFLIFEDKGEDRQGDNYRYRIAESGRIKGLVPCSERGVNGRRYFYYEINSMQSLKDRYAAKGMSFEQLSSLLLDIKNLLEELSEFLMGDEGLVFNTASVYTDLVTGRCRFIFCPFYDESRSFPEFTMGLLDLVDEKDEKATALIYELCEKSAENGDFVYEVIEDVLASSGYTGTQESKNKAAEPEIFAAAQENYLSPEMIDEEDDEEEDEACGKRRGKFGKKDAADKSSKKNSKKNSKKSNMVGTTGSRMEQSENRLSAKIQLVMAVLFMALVGAMVYIRKNYILNSEESLLSIAVMLVSSVTGVIAFIGGYRQMKEQKGGKREQEQEVYEQDLSADTPMDLWDDFSESDFTRGDFAKNDFSRGDFAKNDLSRGDFAGETGYRNNIRVMPSSRMSSREADPETVLLDMDGNENMTLFSTNMGRTIRISLDKLPITLGKMEGCVDTVITDESVSRIHCRFIEDGERVALLDLGSTNGTYRNGVRLSPQQKTYIEEGDEIRLGRVCFDCR